MNSSTREKAEAIKGKRNTRKNTHTENGSHSGQDVLTYENGKGRGSEDFLALADEVIERVERGQT